MSRRVVLVLVLVLVLVALASPRVARAADIPPPSGPLRDDAGVLDGASADAVRGACRALEAETSAEVAVLTLPTTGGEGHHAYALRVFNAWGVGQRGKDNGVLLLFAMADRRVELIPGTGYKALFDEARSTDILTRVVVPRMKAGRPAEAIVACVEEVARTIRARESGGAALPPSSAPPSSAPAAPEPAPAVRAGAGGANHRALGIFLAVAWVAAVLAVFVAAFSGGNLLVPKWALGVLLVLGGGGLAWFVFGAAAHALEGLDFGIGGAGGLASVVGLGLVSHICPRCSKYMSIRSRTISEPTYSSSGTGERTYHCGNCFHHHVDTYTISQLTESSSDSSSDSSWSSSSSDSFGGGCSSGGGGGASW